VASDGFPELFERERAGMVGLAYLVTGSNAVAEEIAHDAFINVYERWERLDNPGAYLRRCVVNAAIRAKQRHAHGERLAVVAAPGEEYTAEFDTTLDLVRGLAPRARALVVLRYYDQLSIEEIADVLDIPAGTVKSGLHRALNQLREVLA